MSKMISLSFLTASLQSLFLGATGATAQLTPNNILPGSSSGLTAIKYSSVGGSGSYNQVTNILPGQWPSCDVNPYCITSPVSTSGALAPFDEDMTLVFRGPMNIYNIAVYQPTANTSSSTWTQVSSWNQGSEPNNLVFMANMGGDVSGNWSICAGASQAYVNGAWNAAAASPNAETYAGYLDGANEINIMTATECSDASPCPGYYWGTANQGWSGSKMFVFTVDMPASSDASQVPAVWALNAQVVRATQYGCNCRGMGGNGGCGELDILEVLTSGNPNQAISELYSFMGATGSGAQAFPRPGSAATYAVIFDVDTDSIVIQGLTQWTYSTATLPRSMIDGYLSAPTTNIAFSTNTRRSPRNFMGAHRRRHHS